MAVELAQRYVNIDLNKCNGCAICAQVCPTGVLDILDKKSVFSRPEDCMGCQLCEAECPMLAIAVQRPVLRLRQDQPVTAAPAATTAAPPPPAPTPAPPPPPAPTPAPPPPPASPAGISVAPPPPPPTAPPAEAAAGTPGETVVQGKPLSHYFRPSQRGG